MIHGLSPRDKDGGDQVTVLRGRGGGSRLDWLLHSPLATTILQPENPNHSGRPRAYRFDGFRVDLARRQLLGIDAAPLALSGRAFDVLIHLIENRDRVVSKDELMSAAWPGIIVEENNLTQAISALRREFGDARGAARFIATVVGRGYRFATDVDVEYDVEPTDQPGAAAEPGDTPPATTRAPDIAIPERSFSRRRIVATIAGAAAVAAGWTIWSRWAQSPQPARSIAVLPFQPLLDSAANEALQIGMADTLIARLSSLPGVVVAPFSSVRVYAAAGQDPLQAGRELGVSAVLESHMQIQPERVRLTARLLDVASGTALWSGSFDEHLNDFFAVQDALAQQVVDVLQVQLTADTRRRLTRHDTENLQAWQLYLQGRFNWGIRTETGFRRAIELYEAALAVDPSFAQPAAGLADVWAVMAVFGMIPPAEAFPRARAAALRAVELDPDLAEGQAALGHVLVQADRSWGGGERQYRLALSQNPNYGQAVFWLANLLCMQGHRAEALVQARRAQSLEPFSVAFAANVGLLEYHARDYAAARKTLETLVDSMPQYALARRFLVRVLLMQGQAGRALDLLRGHESDYAPGGFSDLGRALAQDGQRDAAQAEIQRVETLGAQGFGVGYDLALMHGALGATEASLAALERGVDDGSQTIGFLNSEPGLDPIRNQPRFRAVSRRLGLG